MFDSEFCSLVTITFLIQIFALLTVICYRLRGNGRFNQLGLFCGVALMGATALICMPLDPAAGISQGVALVFVAVSSTFGYQQNNSSAI